MSPAILEPQHELNGHTTEAESSLNLQILGVGTEYPPYQIGPDALETIAKRFYPDCPSSVLLALLRSTTGLLWRSL